MKRHRKFRVLNLILGLVVLVAMLVPPVVAAPPPPSAEANAAAAAAALGYHTGEASVIPQGAKEVPGEIIVGLKERANTAGVQSLAASYGARLVGSIDALNVHLLKVDNAGASAQAMAALAADPAVRFVEANGVYSIDGEVTTEGANAQLTPNDPYRTLQWALTKEKAYDAWNYTTGSALVLVAVVDTGIYCNHPDLDAKCVPGYNFVANNTNATDDNNHGTHVAGKIAAETNNSYGIAGLCWWCKLLPVKVLNSAGSGSWFNVARGIVYAAVMGAKIENLSLGGSSPSTVVQLAGIFAYTGMGVLLVASAGNSGSYAASYPAAYDEFMSVACTTSTDARCSFSTYHPTVEIAAPGYNILSTIRPASWFGYMSGTSMSSPDVSGVAALVWSRNLSRTNAQVRACVDNGADDLGAAGRDIYFGYGRVNALRAVLCGQALGTVQGYVLNATNNAAIAGATVLLVGTSRTVTTNSSGFYQMTGVAAGTRSFTASKSGFVSLTQSVSVPSGGTATLNFSLSPVLATGQWRIVLTWGLNPRDLDSHLWLPSSPTSIRYHVYYANKGSSTAFPWARLDVDDVTSYGPETITIHYNYAGNYRYAVHWYAGSGTWSTSGAVVRIYRGSSLVATRTVPASSLGSWSWWYLMNFNAQTGAISYVNLIQSGSPAPYAMPIEKTEGVPKKPI